MVKGLREQRGGLFDALDRSGVSSSLNDMADCWDWHVFDRRDHDRGRYTVQAEADE